MFLCRWRTGTDSSVHLLWQTEKADWQVDYGLWSWINTTRKETDSVALRFLKQKQNTWRTLHARTFRRQTFDFMLSFWRRSVTRDKSFTCIVHIQGLNKLTSDSCWSSQTFSSDRIGQKVVAEIKKKWSYGHMNINTQWKTSAPARDSVTSLTHKTFFSNATTYVDLNVDDVRSQDEPLRRWTWRYEQ